MSGRRTGTNLVKAKPAMKTSSNAIAGTTGVRATAWGERTGRVNWGPSAAGGLALQPDGIIHNPSGCRTSPPAAAAPQLTLPVLSPHADPHTRTEENTSELQSLQ